MKIETNKVVVMTYEAQVEGKVVDKATEEAPLDYIQGTHMLLPKLEQTVEGLEEGAEFSCSIPPAEGYGEYDLKRVFDVPKTAFEVDGKLREDLMQVGKFIPMLNSAGDVCHALVVDVKEDKVTMDFNPPMAGKTLNFTGKILMVRDATEKELTEGLHGEYLPPEEHQCHCGGGCHGGCHGEGHGEGGCCHGGEGHGEGGCCHGEGHGEGGCCHHHDE